MNKGSLELCICGNMPRIAEGIDTLQVVCDKCGRKGRLFLGDYFDECFMMAIYGMSAILDWNDKIMNEYKKVNVFDYVKEGLDSGIMQIRIAEKFARIVARVGNVGDEVISWSVDSLGNEIKEKVAKVELDKNTNNPGWIVTKADENGNLIIDENGHLNQWIINDSTFKKRYEVDNENINLFKPKGGPQQFVQIPDNIILNQWGSDMKIAKGGFINITNVDDIYGISKSDFEDTYKFVDELNKKKVR